MRTLPDTHPYEYLQKEVKYPYDPKVLLDTNNTLTLCFKIFRFSLSGPLAVTQQ
jgi:hypothetical protein